jgi:hypothetical protein
VDLKVGCETSVDCLSIEYYAKISMNSRLLGKCTHYSMMQAMRYACCYGRICCEVIIAEFEGNAVVWDANSVTSGVHVQWYRTGAFNGVIINDRGSWFSGLGIMGGAGLLTNSFASISNDIGWVE